MDRAIERMKKADHKAFVGANLALARTAIGASLTAWTRRYGLGNGPARLSQWEKGLYYPDPWFLKQLCDDYGFTMDWFYRGIRAGVSAELADGLRQAEADISAA